MVNTTNFGREINCTDGLKTGRFVSGVRLVAQACYRRLRTPRGMLRGGEAEKNYGLDLTELIGSTSTKSAAASLPSRIEQELRKDERVESVGVDVFPTTTNGAVTFTIAIEVETAEGPFTLKIAASSVTVEQLGIEAG